LNLIDTGPSQTIPGQGVFLGSEVLGNSSVKLSFDGARGTTFKLLYKGPGDAVFRVLAEGLTGKTFVHEGVAEGGHTYKVIPSNSAGTGAESVPYVVTVAQQAAA
jgi:hypothetical protein